MDLVFPYAQLIKVLHIADDDAIRAGTYLKSLILANNRAGVFLQSANHQLFVDGEYNEPVVCYANGFNPTADGVDWSAVYEYRRSVMGGDDFFEEIPLHPSTLALIERGNDLIVEWRK